MDRHEFLHHLYLTKKMEPPIKWRFDPSLHCIRGAPPGVNGNGPNYCPITAVCRELMGVELEPSAWETGARELGLPATLADLINSASSASPSSPEAEKLREEMIFVLNLTEI